MTPDEELSAEERAEILRKKAKYRDLLLSGRITLPHDRAARLLGPDCMYHLYGRHRSASRPARRRKKPRRTRSSRTE